MFPGKNFTCPDFRIAQGNHGTANNWWIGSSDCANIPETHSFTCCCGNRACNSSIVPTPGSTNYAISITPGKNDHEFNVRPYAAPGKTVRLDDFFVVPQVAIKSSLQRCDL